MSNDDSIYDNNNLVVHDRLIFERLEDGEHKYRQIFSHDDYDYVEDEELIYILDQLPTI
jgi:hypothetical protein